MTDRPFRMVSCPFHDDQTPSMAIDDGKQLFFCFECRRSGVVGDLPEPDGEQGRHALGSTYRNVR